MGRLTKQRTCASMAADLLSLPEDVNLMIASQLSTLDLAHYALAHPLIHEAVSPVLESRKVAAFGGHGVVREYLLAHERGDHGYLRRFTNEALIAVVDDARERKDVHLARLVADHFTTEPGRRHVRDIFVAYSLWLDEPDRREYRLIHHYITNIYIHVTKFGEIDFGDIFRHLYRRIDALLQRVEAYTDPEKKQMFVSLLWWMQGHINTERLSDAARLW